MAACLLRLKTHGVLVVVGPSGSGKSSLVRAGVSAALQRAGRRVVVVTPGTRRPVDALSAFAAEGAEVLVVDQCEEAVAPDVDPAERRAFFAALAIHATRAPLVIALRADRLSEVSAEEDFARLVERGLFLLGPMTESDLRMAIEGPARNAALLLEPGLVDLVVRDVLDEPGALPLMSHSLRQTWTHRHGRTMTVAAYRETGGIRGAVAQSAEALYADIDAGQRLKLRDLMLRLVSPLDSGEPARARLPRNLLADEPAYDQLIEHLVSARLLTSDGEAVEVAHEALARAWPRLRDWLDEDVEGVRVLRHLSTAAAGWNALGRPQSELYRGVRLAQAVEWREASRPTLAAIERDFLEESVEHQVADLRSAEAQVARERRTVRRLRRLVTGVALLAAVAVVASALAVDQRDRADDEARMAAARRLSAQALVARPQDRALLLAVEAVRLWDSPETRGSLLTTISRSPRLSGVVRTPGAQLLDFDVDAAGQRAAVTDSFGAVSLYDLDTRQELDTLSTSGVLHQSPAFSRDGGLLAVGRMSASCWFGECPDLAIDVFEGGELGGQSTTYRGFGAPAADLAFSPSGEVLAAIAPVSIVDPVGNVAVWRIGQPDRPEHRFSISDTGLDIRATPGALPPGWVVFSPDGRRLYASGAGPIVEFDVATGEVLRSIDGLGGLALSQDGSTLAVRQEGDVVELVDTSTGIARLALDGHDALVTAAAFSDDGSRVATTSTDETVTVWDVETGERVHTLEGHSGSVLNVAFSPDGSMLFSSAADRSLFLWDVASSSGLARPLTESTLDVESESAVLVSPTGDSIAIAAVNVYIVELESNAVTELATEPDEVAWAAYSPDGRHVATVGWDGKTKLFRVGDRSGAPVASRPGRGIDNFGAVAFAGDGTGVFVVDADGIVRELDGKTLEPTGRSVDVRVEANGIRTAPGGLVAVTSSSPDPAGGSDIVFGDMDDGRILRTVHIDSWGPRANFNADGSRYAAGGEDGRLSVIDVATGALAGLRDPVHSGPIAWVTFSPDGKTLASMGFDGDLILSDASTAIPYAHVQPGPANTRATVGYHPDGHTVLVGYQDGLVIAYETQTEAWITEACRIAGRNLNQDEWRDAFGDEPRRATCSGSG